MAKAKKTEVTEVLELPAEEIKSSTLEKLDGDIGMSLKKYNVTDRFLNDLIKKHEGLTISGMDDKEGYLAVKEGRQEFKGTRVLISRICKAGREEAVIIQKKWISKEKELIEIIQPGEDRLEKMEKDFDAEKERIKQERIEMQRTRLRTRMNDLIAMGAINDGVSVYLDSVSFEVTDIRESEEEAWLEDILPEYKKVFDAKEKIRLDNEEKQRQQDKDLQDKKDEFERQQKEFREQQEQFENQKKKAALEKRNFRISQLEKIGMKPVFPSGNYEHEHISVASDDIDTLTDTDWSNTLGIVTESVNLIKKYAEEQRIKNENELLENSRKKASLELRIKEREAELRGLGFSNAGTDRWCVYKGVEIVLNSFEDYISEKAISESTEEEWGITIQHLVELARLEDQKIAMRLREKILNDERLEQEKEKQRQEEIADQASDKVKWAAFLEKINSIKLPEMKRQPYKTNVDTAAALIKKINAI